VNPLSLSIALRRRTTLETCDLALAFVRRAFRPYFTLWLLTLALPGLGLYAVHRATELSWFWTWVLLGAWISVTQGLFTLLGAELLFASEASARRVFARFISNLSGYVGAMIASRVTFALLALTVLLLPRGFAGSALVPEVVLLEGLRGGAALKRARRLGTTFARSMSALGVITVAGFVTAAVLADELGSTVVQFVLQLGSPFEDLSEGGSVYAIVGVVVAAPLFVTARLLAYVGGRAEQDGWDVQLRFQALKAREEPT
jgi:hypothetical protein